MIIIGELETRMFDNLTLFFKKNLQNIGSCDILSKCLSCCRAVYKQVCTKCVKCKSCGATSPGEGRNAVWTHDFSLCYMCGQLMDKGRTLSVLYRIHVIVLVYFGTGLYE